MPRTIQQVVLAEGILNFVKRTQQLNDSKTSRPKNEPGKTWRTPGEHLGKPEDQAVRTQPNLALLRATCLPVG
jgi:hypothetical protein